MGRDRDGKTRIGFLGLAPAAETTDEHHCKDRFDWAMQQSARLTGKPAPEPVTLPVLAEGGDDHWWRP